MKNWGKTNASHYVVFCFLLGSFFHFYAFLWHGVGLNNSFSYVLHTAEHGLLAWAQAWWYFAFWRQCLGSAGQWQPGLLPRAGTNKTWEGCRMNHVLCWNGLLRFSRCSAHMAIPDRRFVMLFTHVLARIASLPMTWWGNARKRDNPEKLCKKNFPPGFVQFLGKKNFSPGFLRIFSWKKNTSNSRGAGIYNLSCRSYNPIYNC